MLLRGCSIEIVQFSKQFNAILFYSSIIHINGSKLYRGQNVAPYGYLSRLRRATTISRRGDIG